MAIIFGVLSQKGGPGKSTIVRGVAVALAQNDWSVKIADFDLKQMTSTEWLRRRLANNITPTVSAEPFASVAQALRDAERYDAIILDSKPEASMLTADIAKASDLIIIPTGLATDDLAPAVALADELRSKQGIPAERILFVMNHVGDSALELEEARQYLAHKPYQILDAHLPEKVGYRRAMDTGRSISETSYKSLNEQAELVLQQILTKIDELTK
jgi:chromosome partitioning protein